MKQPDALRNVPMSSVFDHLQVLSEPARVRILRLVAKEELAVGELSKVVQLPQSTVSRHVKGLLDTGWIRRRRDGTASWLRLAEDLDGVARSLWEVVGRQIESGQASLEDDQRLVSVIAARRVDSRQFFGQFADRWDALREEMFGANVTATAVAGLGDCQRVVDLGCGTGEAVAILATAGLEVVGVDREPAMLDVARRRMAGFDHVYLRQGSLAALPIDDASLDGALCILVLQHVEELTVAFAEIARVLRPGGRLVVVDLIAHDREDYRHTLGHVHLGFDVDQLKGLADAAGMTVNHHAIVAPSPDASGPPLFLAIIERAS